MKLIIDVYFGSWISFYLLICMLVLIYRPHSLGSWSFPVCFEIREYKFYSVVFFFLQIVQPFQVPCLSISERAFERDCADSIDKDTVILTTLTHPIHGHILLFIYFFLKIFYTYVWCPCACMTVHICVHTKVHLSMGDSSPKRGACCTLHSLKTAEQLSSPGVSKFDSRYFLDHSPLCFQRQGVSH